MELNEHTPDPMEEVSWTLAMTMAWIIWRKPERVREYWRDRDAAPAAISGMGYLAAVESGLEAPPLVLFAPAKDDLWRKLESGLLSVNAIDEPTGRPVTIASSDWPHLRLVDGTKGADLQLVSRRPFSVDYRDVRISRSDILSSWPPPPPRGQTVAGERACERWLIEEMKASPSVRPKPKAEFIVGASARFDISKRGALRAWDSAIKAVPELKWALAGAPKKNPH